MAISTYLSIVTLNVNGLNATIKRHRVTEWIKKQDPSVYCLDTQTKSEGMEKDISCKQKGEKSRCCSTNIRQNKTSKQTR